MALPVAFTISRLCQQDRVQDRNQRCDSAPDGHRRWDDDYFSITIEWNSLGWDVRMTDSQKNPGRHKTAEPCSVEMHRQNQEISLHILQRWAILDYIRTGGVPAVSMARRVLVTEGVMCFPITGGCLRERYDKYG